MHMHHIPKPVSTRICIIRHGETEWNVEKRIQGHTDVPLNDTGRAQALAMAFNAAHHRFHAIYSSDMVRTVETARTLAQRDCQRRTLPYWNDVLVPRLRAGRRLLVISHGNTLRGLVMHLDGLSAEAMERVEIPAGMPLVYRFAPDLSVLGREWLEIPALRRAGM